MQVVYECGNLLDLTPFKLNRKVKEMDINADLSLITYYTSPLKIFYGPKATLNYIEEGRIQGGCNRIPRIPNHINLTKRWRISQCLALFSTFRTSLYENTGTTSNGGPVRSGLHAVQERIALSHGSQCGFCTPGIVMSMYTLLRNTPKPTMEQIEENFSGNLCRCTGYRPILEGVRTFSKEAGNVGCGKKNCCQLMSKSEGVNGELNGNHTDEIINGNITEVLFDPKEFAPYDPSQEIIFPPELKLDSELDHQSLEYRGERVTFFRPTSLTHILQLKAKHPNAKLVVGNTEVGVEVKFKNQVYPVIINPSFVPELFDITKTQDGVEFGAAVTLSSIEETLKKEIHEKKNHSTRIFTAVLEMFRWFAGKQIRNAAAIGGNIMTGSPISDLNPLLMAAGAILTLKSTDGERKVVMDGNFFTGYRRNIVSPKEILLSILIPYTDENEYFFGYKQARRRDDDIAIVNAGMKVCFKPNTNQVINLHLAFGGMAPTTVMANKTMKVLAGKYWDTSLLELASETLLEDLPLPPSVPGGMVEYRRALTLSFFFKFYLSVRGHLSEKVPDLCQPLSEEECRAVQLHQHQNSKSTQLWQKVSPGQLPIDPIGRPLAHMSALNQVTGEAVYVDDMPKYNNELYAALVLSSKPHAKIISIDESEAMKIKGVERFFCHRDLPGELNITGSTVGDEEVFASNKVTCVGQVIGLIIAKDQAIAQKAAKLVNVEYKEIQPVIITIQDAIQEKSWWDPWTINKGEVEGALANAQHVLEGEMHMGGQEQFYLETNAHLAVPLGEDGAVELFSSTQNPTKTQALVARALGVPSSHVVCRVKRMGGGFGGKETRTTLVSVPISVAAVRLNCPVRCMLDRDEDMILTGGRHPFLGRWRVGFNDEGVVSVLCMDLYANAGCSIDLSVGVVHRAMFTADNAYNIPNFRVTGYACRTNLPSNTAFRGFGGPQGMIFAEEVISRVAAFCGLDHNLVQEHNLYKTGDLSHINNVLERCTVRQCWDEVIQQSDFYSRLKAVQKFNKENRYVKRGLTMTPMKYGIAFGVCFLNQAGALVLVYTDGSVLLTHGGTEMGQGLHTKMIQVASRVLQIPCSRIHISETSTNTVPNTSPTAASASSDLNGGAVQNACEIIMERLAPYRKSNPEGCWDDWIKAAYFDRVSLSATGFYKYVNKNATLLERNEFCALDHSSHIPYPIGIRPELRTCYALILRHKVIRTDIVMDVGDSLNPAIDIGQIEGAFVQGQGLFTLEELRYSPQGVLLTRGPGAYKIPGFADIPLEFNVSLLRNAPNPSAVFSSKAVGEPPLLLAASVLYALKQAVASVRKEQGVTTVNGPNAVFRMDSPATAERLRLACQDSITKKIKPAEPGTFTPWSVTV
ncbi:unnamed protein product, partial [Meganyctiphanes norvegica]